MPNEPIDQRRRGLIRTAGAAAIAALGAPTFGANGAKPDIHIELEAVPDRVAVREGAPTRVWRYRGRLLRGDANALEPSAGAYLGPIIRARRGQRVRIELINRLPEATIIHWHGLHVPEAMDGHPRFAIASGE